MLSVYKIKYLDDTMYKYLINNY